jgi:hypothetical protein
VLDHGCWTLLLGQTFGAGARSPPRRVAALAEALAVGSSSLARCEDADVRLPSYRSELVVLMLVALSTLSVVELAGPQDRTRYELTRHIVLARTLTVEPTLFDRAVYGGHSYSDKAPGMSFLATPVFELERIAGVARAPRQWESEGDLSLWGIRVATSGTLFLLTVLLVGRVAEELVRGTGALAAAVYGVCTIAAPLAPTFFEHDAAGFFAFAGFLLVRRARLRPALLALAGASLGTAVLFQYAAVLIAVAVLLYAAVVAGRIAWWILLGALPPALALGAYDWAAFGSPFHLSYKYVANRYTEQQHGGFFGIGVPTFEGLRDALVVHRGLLVFSPVLLGAAVGLWWMAQHGRRAEAVLCGAVALLFLWLDAGYFLPYGGNSPGPRFFAPALPFLVLGIPFAAARLPRSTLALAALSAGLTAADALTWSVRPENDGWYPRGGLDDVAKTVWMWLGPSRTVGAAIVLGFALATVAVGARQVRRAA